MGSLRSIFDGEEIIFHDSLEIKNDQPGTSWSKSTFYITQNLQTSDKHFNYISSKKKNKASYSCSLKDMDIYITNDDERIFNITCNKGKQMQGRREFVLKAQSIESFDLWISYLDREINAKKQKNNKLVADTSLEEEKIRSSVEGKNKSLENEKN